MKKLFTQKHIVHLKNGWELTRRTATKKTHSCSNFGKPNNPEYGGCLQIIPIGEQYYDTNERIGNWKTVKFCIVCGKQLIEKIGTNGTTIGTINF